MEGATKLPDCTDPFGPGLTIGIAPARPFVGQEQ